MYETFITIKIVIPAKAGIHAAYQSE